MIRSLFAGVSGMRNYQAQMDVIGNNIANINTIGFKAGRVIFEDILAQTILSARSGRAGIGGVNPQQIGLGIGVKSIDTIFTQGGLQFTNMATDLAIQGNGFFVLSDGVSRYYTRAGAFSLDNNGYLTNPGNGMIVQGKIATNGAFPPGTPVEDIRLPVSQKLPARATTNVDFSSNLNAAETPLGTVVDSSPLLAIATGTDDMNGLYANGAADTFITGLVANSTTVTVTDGGTVGAKTYTYVAADTGVGTGDFHSIADLIDEINNDFSATSFSATFDAPTGAITMADTSGAANVLTFSSTNANLQSALAAANGDCNAAATVTDEFSHTVTGADALTALRNSTGTNLGLATDDVVSINGSIAGSPITTVTQTVGTDITTLQDFVDAIETAFGITNATGVIVDTAQSSVEINGDAGTANEITGVNITANTAVPAPVPEFNAVFDSSPGNWIETQSASDVIYSTTSTVYDSQGGSHELVMTFTKSDVGNQWTWEATIPGITPIGGNTGTISFNSDGSLSSFTYDGGTTSLTFDPGTGANLASIAFNVGTVGGFDGITQFAFQSNAAAQSQDGYGMGVLESFGFDETGIIQGVFSNGVTQVLARLVLANFNNQSGLLKTGESLYQESANSGQAVMGEAGTGSLGTISPGTLEMSNVDLANEFTNIIIAQRGFQANSRVITTVDAMLTDLINLKRA